MELKDYSRTTFDVKAVQVTNENIREVAEWMGTCVQTHANKYGDRKFVNITIARIGGHDRFVPVFVGDWVTLANGSFQRCSDKKFHAIFQEHKSDSEKRYQIRELLADAMTVQATEEFWGLRNDVVDKTAEKILEIFK